MAAEPSSSLAPGPPTPAGPATPASHADMSARPMPRPPAATARRTARQLSEEALAKKRANDREAQRNIREKTRQKIDGLERRVKELESGKAYQQLQAVVREREELRIENTELKARLGKILQLITPVLGPGDCQRTPSAPAAATSELHPSPPAPPRPQTSATSATAVPAYTVPPGPAQPMIAPQDPAAPPQSYSTPSDYTVSGTPTNTSWHGQPLAETPRPMAHPPLPPEPRSATSWQSPAPALSPWSGSAHSPHAHANQVPSPSTIDPSPGAERHPRQTWAANGREKVSAASSPRSHTAASPWQPSATVPAKRPQPDHHSPVEASPQSFPSPSTAQPYYTRRPNNNVPLSAHTSWCRSILPIIQEKHKLLEAGHPDQDVIGSPHPDFTDIEWVYSSTIDPDSPDDNLSHFVMQLLKAFTGINQAPQRIGTMSVTYYLLRWYIAPTQANYELIPEFLKPIQEQLDIPHPPWVDYIHWPAMRAKMVYLWREIPLDTFFQPYSNTLAVNWPYGSTLETVLCKPSAESQDEEQSAHDHAGVSNGAMAKPKRAMRPAFEAHIRKLENWSLGPVFAQWFPALAGTHRVKHDGRKELFS